jgi:uncharacterized membrane protein YgcG
VALAGTFASRHQGESLFRFCSLLTLLFHGFGCVLGPVLCCRLQPSTMLGLANCAERRTVSTTAVASFPFMTREGHFEWFDATQPVRANTMPLYFRGPTRAAAVASTQRTGQQQQLLASSSAPVNTTKLPDFLSFVDPRVAHTLHGHASAADTSGGRKRTRFMASAAPFLGTASVTSSLSPSSSKRSEESWSSDDDIACQALRLLAETSARCAIRALDSDDGADVAAMAGRDTYQVVASVLASVLDESHPSTSTSTPHVERGTTAHAGTALQPWACSSACPTASSASVWGAWSTLPSSPQSPPSPPSLPSPPLSAAQLCVHENDLSSSATAASPAVHGTPQEVWKPRVHDFFEPVCVLSRSLLFPDAKEAPWDVYGRVCGGGACSAPPPPPPPEQTFVQSPKHRRAARRGSRLPPWSPLQVPQARHASTSYSAHPQDTKRSGASTSERVLLRAEAPRDQKHILASLADDVYDHGSSPATQSQRRADQGERTLRPRAPAAADATSTRCRSDGSSDGTSSSSSSRSSGGGVGGGGGAGTKPDAFPSLPTLARSRSETDASRSVTSQRSSRDKASTTVASAGRNDARPAHMRQVLRGWVQRAPLSQVFLTLH